MPTAEGTMKNIFTDYYLFGLDAIIREYESHLINTDTVLKDNNCETQELIQPCFRVYDTYKLLIEINPVWLLNILCCLLFVNF